MASVHRQPGRPYWFGAFTEFDPQTFRPKRVFRSTKTRDRKQALEICRAWQKAALLARNGKLSVDTAREVIAQGVADVFTHANVESLPSAAIKPWCDAWLNTKAIEAEESTHERYKRIVHRFLESLGAKANRDLSTLTADDISRFRNHEAKARARATANLSLKVLRVCFGEAVRQGLLAVNPASRVKLLKSSKESKRRAFTLSEIKRILKACSDDQEWRGLVLFGLYLGQRLGDLAKLTWRAIDLESREVAFTAQKTGRRIVLPLTQPLIDYLSGLPASDNRMHASSRVRPVQSAPRHSRISSGRFWRMLALWRSARTKHEARPLRSTRGERDIVSFVATQRSDDAQSLRSFGRVRTRDCRARERGSVAAIYAPDNRRPAQCDATVARCD